jgi:hypothetical protein
MICPKCEAEFTEGITICSDCGTELISKEQFNLGEEEASTIPPDEWKEVFASADAIEIEMVKANLKGAGIEAISLSKQDRTKLNIYSAGADAVKLFVREEDVETAEQIISDINNTEIKEDE